MKKKGNTNRKGEGQLYDKIMRENLQELFLPLIAEELNFKFKSVQPLPDKQPTTIIRETDAFLLVETYSLKEPKFILHLEFESKDNEEMVYRISEYHGIELRKYRLPIKHVVVYLGEGTPKMKTELELFEVFRGFTLVNAHSFSPQKWLEENEPAKIIMAILADYQKQNAAIILEAIVSKLRKVCKNQSDLKKFIEQLIIISRMRNLEKLTIQISKAMPITIDIEKDYLYNLGLEKAQKEAKKAAKEAEIKIKAAEAKAKMEAEKAEKEAEKAKVADEKAEAADEKAKAEAEKAKADKKTAIQKMKSTDRFSDEEIIEFLSLDEDTFKEYLNEIEATNQINESSEEEK
jgi:hypothetical protein